MTGLKVKKDIKLTYCILIHKVRLKTIMGHKKVDLDYLLEFIDKIFIVFFHLHNIALV